jgi:hypothetical protein
MPHNRKYISRRRSRRGVVGVSLGVAWCLVQSVAYRRSKGLLLIKVSDISATIGASDISVTTHRLKTSTNSNSVCLASALCESCQDG